MYKIYIHTAMYVCFNIARLEINTLENYLKTIQNNFVHVKSYKINQGRTARTILKQCGPMYVCTGFYIEYSPDIHTHIERGVDRS